MRRNVSMDENLDLEGILSQIDGESFRITCKHSQWEVRGNGMLAVLMKLL